MKNLDFYFKQSFPHQLRLLNFQRPNPIVRDQIMSDPHVLFFGGKDWERVDKDLESIPQGDQLAFLLCLFMITISDQNLYRYYKELYPVWRKHTRFPKFGWCGFGPHHENPMKILTVPEEKGLISIEGNEVLVSKFAELFSDQAKQVEARYGIEVTREEFFETMTSDPDYVQAEGKLAELVKNNLKKSLSYG